MKLKNRIKVRREATQNAVALLSALTQLVKAKTELDRTRASRIPLGGFPASPNRSGGFTNDFEWAYTHGFKAGGSLGKFLKDLQDMKEPQFAKGKDSVKEPEANQQPTPEPTVDAKKPQYTAPAMKRVNDLELNHIYLAVHKRIPMAQANGQFIGYEDDKVKLVWGNTLSYADPNDHYFFEYSQPQPII